MKLTTFIFHVEPSKVKFFKEIVLSCYKWYYPNSLKNVTFTISGNLLVVKTCNMHWLWIEVSSFVNSILSSASEKDVLVVCESVNF